MLRVGACLSLTGRYARFGRQAASGLRAWRDLTGGAELVVEDDGSDPERLAAVLAGAAARCDLLLGPYSTGLARAAVRAVDGSVLLWNHGGAGDGVQTARPRRVVSILTPASRYAEPFVDRLAAMPERAPLGIATGRGSFGRSVAAGAATAARRLGLAVVETAPDGTWDLLSAGSFEEDAAAVGAALALSHPPRTVCSVSAGVREFAAAVPGGDGVLGIAQWFPGAGAQAALGPAEADLITRYRELTGAEPDYPAIQAAAAAVIATHCASAAGSTEPDALWAAAARLRTSTLFGPFAIDPATGAQTDHRTVLVRWTNGRPEISP